MISSNIVQEHRRTFPVSETTLLRLGLAGAGALLLYLASLIVFSAPATRFPTDVLILIVVGAAGLGLIAAAGLAHPPRALGWLILVACIVEVLVRAVLWAQTAKASDYVIVDQGLYTDMAGQLLRHGQNPYTWDLAGAFDLYRTNQLSSTPRLNASNENNYPYPPLAFLLAAALQAIGLPGTFTLSIIAEIAVLVLLFLIAPRFAQPVVLLPIIAGFDFTLLSLLGTLDIFWVALLLGMVATWKQPTWRAIFFGLAAATKQAPWLILPFLLIRIWQDRKDENPLRAVAHFALVAEAGFLLVNGPFMFLDIRAWFVGVTQPLRDTIVYYTQGSLASLTQIGLLALPKNFYLLAMVAILGLLLFAYARHYAVLRNALWLMPGAFMWFSYRSLVSYWAPWVFLILADLVVNARPLRVPAPKRSWVPTLALASAILGALFAGGLLLASAPASVQVRPQLPMRAVQGRVAAMTVEVTNHSSQEMAPRFSVQATTTFFNPLAWQIDQGPLSLAPGQSATYQISTTRDDRTFLVYQGAQIVVTDAGGNYSLRGIWSIMPDTSYLWPDAIANPTFEFWDKDQSVPIFWGLSGEPDRAGSASIVSKDDRNALRLALDSGERRVDLQNWIVFPSEPFAIWVYADPANNLASVAYGVEIRDRTHRLQFLLGDQDSEGMTGDGTYVIRRRIVAPGWSRQVIDVPAAFARAGWSVPTLELATYRDLDTALSLASIHLILVNQGAPVKLQAYFGPIEQDYAVNPRTLMAQTLDNPTGYYLRLGQWHIHNRNYARAVESYQRVLEFSPQNSEALNGIERAKIALAEAAQ